MALFKKTDKEGKRKGLESTIGKIIYGFLLFAPLLLALTTSAYVIFNKNAFESYYGETINEEIKIEKNVDELEVNKTYYMTLNNLYVDSFTIYVENCENISTGTTYPNVIRLYSYRGANNSYIDLYDQNNNLITAFNTGTSAYELKFKYLGIVNKQNCTYQFYEQAFNKYSYLDNNFEYGLYKAENSPLFNWSKNTGTYTVLQNVCNEIGITNTFTPMLMSYWLLISIIYFIYDIALMLILILHKKIHELTESV